MRQRETKKLPIYRNFLRFAQQREAHGNSFSGESPESILLGLWSRIPGPALRSAPE
jgi:hypothetical protein